MWIFTKYGFFSAVCAREGMGEYGQPVDTERIMVRARSRRHLDTLIARFPQELGGTEIHESNASDYRFRIFLEKTVWAGIVNELAAETDYDNFKNAVAKTGGREGHDYHHALGQVWSVMYGLQEHS